MSTPPAESFEVVERAGGRLYRLAPHRFGVLRAVAIAPLVPAVGVSWLLVHFYLSYAAKGPLDEVAWTVFILVGLLWTRVLYTLVSLAAVIVCGRGEVWVADSGAVRAVDRAGWFRIRWGKLKPGTARALVLTELAAVTDETGRSIPSPAALWQLSAETNRAKKVWLAVAYPRETLTALAAALAERLAITRPNEPSALGTTDTPERPLPIVVEEAGEEEHDLLVQPPGSRVTLERHRDGVTLTVPPQGILRAYGGLIIFGLIFGTVGALVTVGTAIPLFQANPKLPSPAIIVGLVFFTFGSVTTVCTINAGRKTVVLAVAAGEFHTFESAPLGTRRRAFARAELLDVVCGPGKINVNNRPLMQLQIVPREGKRVGMLTGRAEAELVWIAAVLRHALGISSDPPNEVRRSRTSSSETERR